LNYARAICVIHDEKGPKQVRVEPAKVVYANWFLPPENEPEQAAVLA